MLPVSAGSALGLALDGAYMVRYDKKRGYILAWFGSFQFNAYLPNGELFHVWSVDQPSNNGMTADDAFRLMGNRIEDGEYRDDR